MSLHTPSAGKRALLPMRDTRPLGTSNRSAARPDRVASSAWARRRRRASCRSDRARSRRYHLEANPRVVPAQRRLPLFAQSDSWRSIRSSPVLPCVGAGAAPSHVQRPSSVRSAFIRSRIGVEGMPSRFKGGSSTANTSRSRLAKGSRSREGMNCDLKVLTHPCADTLLRIPVHTTRRLEPEVERLSQNRRQRPSKR